MTTNTDKEREAFEAFWKGRYCTKWNAPVFDSLDRDGDRYKSGVVHEQWETWQARAQHGKGVAADELEKLADEWDRIAKGLAGVASKHEMDAMKGCAYDLRTLIAKSGE